jgi:hypothetical protein
MRMLLKASMPIAEGNAAVVSGKLGTTIESILNDLKPEAVYFVEENGARTALVFFNLADSSQIPAIAEPWFLAFNAKVQLHPAMNLEDLKKSAPAMESAAKKYGRAAGA